MKNQLFLWTNRSNKQAKIIYYDWNADLRSNRTSFTRKFLLHGNIVKSKSHSAIERYAVFCCWCGYLRPEQYSCWPVNCFTIVRIRFGGIFSETNWIGWSLILSFGWFLIRLGDESCYEWNISAIMWNSAKKSSWHVRNCTLESSFTWILEMTWLNATEVEFFQYFECCVNFKFCKRFQWRYFMAFKSLGMCSKLSKYRRRL